MMTATKKATEKLKDNLVQEFVAVGLGFRLVSHGHKSCPRTFSIKVDHECPGDKVLESGDIRIFLDSKSASSVKNFELDYVDEPGGGFCLKSRDAGDMKAKKH